MQFGTGTAGHLMRMGEELENELRHYDEWADRRLYRVRVAAGARRGGDRVRFYKMDVAAQRHRRGRVRAMGRKLVFVLKVRKIGNSLGVVLPKAALKRMNAAKGGRFLLIEGPDGTYQLTPYDPAFEKKTKKAGEIIGRYRNTLRALSK
jgi:hypothetical protein